MANRNIKTNKDQVKREVEKVLSGLTLYILTPGLTQSGTLPRSQSDLGLFSYAAALQKEVETGPEISNIILPNKNKRNCIILFGA